MDGLNQVFISILSLSIGGISVGTIIGCVIFVVKNAKRTRKLVKKNQDDIVVTKANIEQAFQEAVLPKTIRLDISKKIEKPIKEGLLELQRTNDEALKKIHDENILILKIMSKFTHVKKLSDEDQAKIAEIIDDEAEIDVEV